jgi:hypothetical protein
MDQEENECEEREDREDRRDPPSKRIKLNYSAPIDITLGPNQSVCGMSARADTGFYSVH